MRLPVNVFAMTNRGNGHDGAGVVNFVKDSVVADSNTPPNLSALQFLAARRSWISAKRQQALLNQFVGRRGYCKMFFLSPPQNYNSIVHLRLMRFSASACSRGIGISPEAFASSIARMSSASSSFSISSSYSSMLMTTAILSPFSLVRNCVGSFMFLPLEKSTPAGRSQQERRFERAAKSQSGQFRRMPRDSFKAELPSNVHVRIRERAIGVNQRAVGGTVGWQFGAIDRNALCSDNDAI